MSCTKFNNCLDKNMKQMEYPEDKESLYADRIYDMQTADRVCRGDSCGSNSLDSLSGGIEGFGRRLTFRKFLKWIIILLLVYLILSVIVDCNSEEVSIPSTITKVMENTVGQSGGGWMTESEFNF